MFLSTAYVDHFVASGCILHFVGTMKISHIILLVLQLHCLFAVANVQRLDLSASMYFLTACMCTILFFCRYKSKSRLTTLTMQILIQIHQNIFNLCSKKVVSIQFLFVLNCINMNIYVIFSRNVDIGFKIHIFHSQKFDFSFARRNSVYRGRT